MRALLQRCDASASLGDTELGMGASQTLPRQRGHQQEVFRPSMLPECLRTPATPSANPRGYAACPELRRVQVIEAARSAMLLPIIELEASTCEP
jgi:hypothetical protein